MNSSKSVPIEYRDAESEPAREPIVFLFVFGAVWCVFVGFFDFHLLGDAYRQARTLSWAETPARIISSKVEAHHGKGIHYEPRVSYGYSAGGVEHIGNRYGFVEMSSSDGWAQSMVAQYPAGSTRACYYDPNAPASSVLLKGLQGRDVSLVLFLAPFNLAAIGMLSWALVSAHARRIQKPVGWRRDALGREVVCLAWERPLTTLFTEVMLLSLLLVMFPWQRLGRPPGAAMMALFWAGGVAISALVAGFQFAQNRSGENDLVIDTGDRTVRWKKAIIRFDEISTLVIEPIPMKRRRGGVRKLSIATSSGLFEVLTASKPRVEALALWIRDKTN